LALDESFDSPSLEAAGDCRADGDALRKARIEPSRQDILHEVAPKVSIDEIGRRSVSTFTTSSAHPVRGYSEALVLWGSWSGTEASMVSDPDHGRPSSLRQKIR
jgi:hypothetical protein